MSAKLSRCKRRGADLLAKEGVGVILIGMDTITADLMEDVRSGRTTNRMSARSGRVEILPGAERRRSWTLEQKREIVSVLIFAEN